MLSVHGLTLPRVNIVGNRLPSVSDIESMHHEAHAECFIANSVKTEVLCELS